MEMGSGAGYGDILLSSRRLPMSIRVGPLGYLAMRRFQDLIKLRIAWNTIAHGTDDFNESMKVQKNDYKYSIL